jgi:hypothetical protein
MWAIAWLVSIGIGYWLVYYQYQLCKKVEQKENGQTIS